MRVSVWRTFRAVATLTLAFSLAGCGLQSSAHPAPGGSRKSGQDSRAKHEGHSSTAPHARSLVNTTVYAPPISGPAPALDNLTRVSTTGIITVKGVPYIERLPGPGWTLVYAVIPTGILWTLAAPPSRATSHAAQPNANASSTIYLTPLASPSSMAGAAHPRPVPLTDGHALIAAAPPQHATSSLHTSLTAGVSSALYSDEWAVPGARTVFSLYFLPYNGSPTLLLQRKLHPLQAIEAWPTAHGAIVAQATETAYGWHVDNAAIVNPSKANQPTPLPAPHWPLNVSQQGHAVAFQSGAQLSLIEPDGQVTTEWAAPNPHMLASVRADLPNWTLLLPGAFSDALGGAWNLTSASPGTYRLSLVTAAPNPQQLTALVTQAVRPTRGAALPSNTEPLDVNGQNSTYAAIPSYFGAWRTEHAFQLSSQENVMVQWMETTSRHQPGRHEWFASFHSGVWTYHIGPFTSPANRGQTATLSYLIGHALAQTPTSLAVSGAADIRIAGPSGDVVSSQLRFATADGLRVRLNGPGLEPLSTAGDWTLWSPAKKPSG